MSTNVLVWVWHIWYLIKWPRSTSTFKQQNCKCVLLAFMRPADLENGICFIVNLCCLFYNLKPNNSNTKPECLSIILDTGDGPVEEQCERLQYDPNQWEFPRERLKLGTLLNFIKIANAKIDVFSMIDFNCFNGFGTVLLTMGERESV